MYLIMTVLPVARLLRALTQFETVLDLTIQPAIALIADWESEKIVMLLALLVWSLSQAL